VLGMSEGKQIAVQCACQDADPRVHKVCSSLLFSYPRGIICKAGSSPGRGRSLGFQAHWVWPCVTFMPGCYSSMALAAGIHPKVVSDRLGDSTISITLDTYSHAIPALQEEAAATVAALVND